MRVCKCMCATGGWFLTRHLHFSAALHEYFEHYRYYVDNKQQLWQLRRLLHMHMYVSILLTVNSYIYVPN